MLSAKAKSEAQLEALLAENSLLRSELETLQGTHSTAVDGPDAHHTSDNNSSEEFSDVSSPVGSLEEDDAKSIELNRM